MPTIVKRIIACLLDLVLVALLSIALSVSPLNPNADAISEFELQYREFLEEWDERVVGVDEDSDEAVSLVKEYKTVSENYMYDGTKLAIYENIIIIAVTIVYFVLIPLLNEGATLGKKIMKLRVCKKDGSKVDLISMSIRALILFGIFFNLINMLAVYVMSKSSFAVLYILLTYTSYIFNLGVILTVFFRQDRRGLHDLLAGTMVEERK